MIITGSIIGVTSNIILKHPSQKLYYILSIGIVNLILLSLILESLLIFKLQFYTTFLLLIALFFSAFLSFYVYNYKEILCDVNVAAFILTTIVIVSLVISPFYVPADSDADSLPLYVINPMPSTTPLFQDYIEILTNPSHYIMERPYVFLPSNLELYSNLVYNLLGKFINYSYSIKNTSNLIYISLHNGNTSLAMKYYTRLLQELDNITIVKNNITYYVNILGLYSSSTIFQKFLFIMNMNYTYYENIVKNYYIIMSFIYKLPKSSHIPVEVKINKITIPFNKTIEIIGYLTSRYNYSINGTVFITYLNRSENINVTNNMFSFPITLTSYVKSVSITILYTGNNIFLPNITKFTLDTNVIFTKLYVKLIPFNPYVGSNLTIMGYVNGNNRTLIVSLLNYSKVYVVSGNFTVKFPIPYNLTNTTYFLNITVLPKGYLSPITERLIIIPRLYHENLIVNVQDRWIIPLPLKISGKIYYNNTPLNNVKIFIFIGNSRYEVIAHNGYFSTEISPKITILFGKQIIFVESDPQYTYYREVVEVYTLIYNLLVIFLFPIIMVVIFIFIKRRTKGMSKQFKLREIMIGGSENEK